MAKQPTVVIVHKNPDRYGKMVNLPDIGEVMVSDDGEVEVNEETAKLLCENAADSWRYRDMPEGSEEENGPGDEEEEEESTEEGEDTEGGDPMEEAPEEYLNENFSYTELRALCKDEGFKKEISDLNTKAKVLEFLKDNWARVSNKTKKKLAKLMEG